MRRCASRLILEERCQIPYLSQTLPTPRSCSGRIHQRRHVIQVLTTPWTFCDSDTGGHLWSVMPGPSSLSVPCVLAGSHPISLLQVSSTCYQFHPWSHMDMDFVTDLPPSDGHRVILTIVDQFSKAAHFVPLPKLPSAAETGDLLVRHVFHHNGIPRDIVSDRGLQFTSQVWRSFCTALGASVSFSSAYHLSLMVRRRELTRVWRTR